MRKPIYLDRHSVALITVYTRPDEIEDIWVTDYPAYDNDHEQMAKEAAEQFIEQLQGRWTPLFLKALQAEIEKRLE